MKVRGIRGAITVEKNDREEILEATTELLKQIVEDNNLVKEDIASVFFSMTSDLDKVFPAVAARQLGWTDMPLFCTKELDIADSLTKCIRILIHYNTDSELKDINHIYLRRAKKLRPDLVK